MSKIKNWALRKAIAAQTRDEEGQGLVEYGLIIALVALGATIALTALGTDISTLLGNVGDELGV